MPASQSWELGICWATTRKTTLVWRIFETMKIRHMEDTYLILWYLTIWWKCFKNVVENTASYLSRVSILRPFPHLRCLTLIWGVNPSIYPSRSASELIIDALTHISRVWEVWKGLQTRILKQQPLTSAWLCGLWKLQLVLLCWISLFKTENCSQDWGRTETRHPYLSLASASPRQS